MYNISMGHAEPAARTHSTSAVRTAATPMSESHTCAPTLHVCYVLAFPFYLSPAPTFLPSFHFLRLSRVTHLVPPPCREQRVLALGPCGRHEVVGATTHGSPGCASQQIRWPPDHLARCEPGSQPCSACAPPRRHPTGFAGILVWGGTRVTPS